MKLYTIEEYMKEKNISEPTIYSKKEKGELSVSKINNKNYILEDTACRIISIGNIKGGAGKSTAAVSLASFSALSGLNTLLIDFDHQNNCQYFFSEDAMNKSIYSTYDLIFNGKEIEECTINTDVVGLDIILSSEKLVLEAPTKDLPIVLLKKKLELIKDKYNLIFIDTSPNFDIYNQNAFIASDYVLMSTKLHPLYIKGIEQLWDGIQPYIDSGELNILGIFKNMVDRRFKRTDYYSEVIDKSYEDLVFKTFIRTDSVMEYLSLDRKNLFYNDKKTKSQDDYKSLFKEILERL